MNRIHKACGQPMVESVFGNHDPNPQLRSQPIWHCVRCSAWEPREGWHDELPTEWDERTDAWRAA